MPSIVNVVTPSRLHFGLLGFGDASERQFGGVGVMIDQPGLHVRFTRSSRTEFHGPSSDRVAEFLERWSAFHKIDQPATCRIDVLDAPPSHVGLGSGTQLGLAVAAGLDRLFEKETSIVDTARSVGRGLRSAVGTYGFFQGGLIWERGKAEDEAISPLEQRVAIPADWRFVLICPTEQTGLSGELERSAMAGLPPVPAEKQDRLSNLVEDRMLPALARQSCVDFGNAVFEYGQASGAAFAAIQGGVYNGPRLTQLVDRVRACGGVGVGQSSWGPVLYVIVPDEVAARTLVDQLHQAGDLEAAKIWISTPNNQGAQITVEA